MNLLSFLQRKPDCMITMAITEINALRESLLRFVSIIQDLGDSYFVADAALAEFPLRVELLKARHEILEAYFMRYGLRHSPSFLEAVKEAQKLLNREVAKLEGEAERACCPIGQICRPVSGMLFSKSVGLHIRIVQDAYDSILEHLRTESQLHDMGSRSVLRRSFSLPFRKDGHYVPLKRSEEKLYSALEAAPAVVLLYGGPGKGKSTLARQVSLSYKEGNSTFAQLVMLECGPKVDVAAKMTDLLQKLGSEFPERSQTLRDDFKVVKLLQNYLKKQKLLIVLDDLWERDLIQELFNLSGPGVKFLITSQVAHLCDGFHSGDKTCVLMEDLKHEDSRRILATHAGFEDQDIPPHLQEIEDKIIAQAEANPLVMATLGARIAIAGKEKLEVWESVSDDLLQLLDERTLVNVHGIGYQRSFWATMQISISALSRKQKELLVLMSMCKSPSVSKSAIQILYSTAISHERCNTLDFSLLCSELKSRHLLAEQNTESLSIHSLTKGFILEQMKDTVKHVTTLLNKPNFVEQGKISTSKNRLSLINVLVYLYIDTEYSREATMQVHPPSNQYISDETQSRRASLKRNISEVIMELLVLEARPSNKWTEELSMYANQVLLEFVCNDHFCDHKISKLLHSPTAMGHILTFLINVSRLHESYWKQNIIQSTSGILQSLLNILQDNSHPIHQAHAALILAIFSSRHEENPKNIASVSGMLPQLVLSLLQVQNPNLQIFAATILVNMANVKKCGGSTIDTLISYPGLVDTMVKFLNEESNVDLQGLSIVMLENLITANTHTGDLARWPGLVEGLAKTLLADNNHVHHGFVAAAIAQLADIDEEATLPKLLKYPRLVDNLVKSISEEQNSGFLVQSIFLLDKLIDYCVRASTFHKIVDWCGPLEGLAKLILKAQDPFVQGRIALTLGNMISCTKAKDTIVGDTLFTCPGLLEKLIKSLQEDSNTDLQQGAALVFANLAITDSNKHKLVMSLGLLEGLAKSLIKSDNILQRCAVGAIANMADMGGKIIHDKLLNQPGLVDYLVQSLHKDQNSDMQIASMAALCNLTATCSSILGGWPGLLSGLEKVLIKGDNPSLQERAAAVIANLAITTSKKLLNHSRLIDKLVKSLDEDQNPELQQISAMALYRITNYSLENNV